MLAHYIGDFVSVVLINPRKSYALITIGPDLCQNRGMEYDGLETITSPGNFARVFSSVL